MKKILLLFLISIYAQVSVAQLSDIRLGSNDTTITIATDYCNVVYNISSDDYSISWINDTMHNTTIGRYPIQGNGVLEIVGIKKEYIMLKQGSGQRESYAVCLPLRKNVTEIVYNSVVDYDSVNNNIIYPLDIEEGEINLRIQNVITDKYLDVNIPIACNAAVGYHCIDEIIYKPRYTTIQYFDKYGMIKDVELNVGNNMNYILPHSIIIDGDTVEKGIGYILHTDDFGNRDSLPFEYSDRNFVFSKEDFFKYCGYKSYIDEDKPISYADDTAVQRVCRQFDTIGHIKSSHDRRYDIPLNDKSVTRDGGRLLREGWPDCDYLERVDICFTLFKKNHRKYDTLTFVANFPLSWMRVSTGIIHEEFFLDTITYRITTLRNGYYIVALVDFNNIPVRYFKSIENKKKELRLKKRIFRKHKRKYKEKFGYPNWV